MISQHADSQTSKFDPIVLIDLAIFGSPVITIARVGIILAQNGPLAEFVASWIIWTHELPHCGRWEKKGGGENVVFSRALASPYSYERLCPSISICPSVCRSVFNPQIEVFRMLHLWLCEVSVFGWEGGICMFLPTLPRQYCKPAFLLITLLFTSKRYKHLQRYHSAYFGTSPCAK